ncbi:Protein B602L [Nosema granulosis]|uniref:Protein B602L n=1 Tax=Nosema granulosis TaxID=83296 RepID=A0A9P6GXR0_9MICR|nr:Protein B602L [Nosema granulosis]
MEKKNNSNFDSKINSGTTSDINSSSDCENSDASSNASSNVSSNASSNVSSNVSSNASSNASSNVSSNVSSNASSNVSSNVSSSLEYDSEDIQLDVCVESNPQLDDYEMFLERAKLFNSIAALNGNILKCISIKSAETVLSFMMAFKYDKLLKTIPKNIKKSINKVIESNFESFYLDQEETVKRVKTDQIHQIKERMVLLYTDRFCDLDPLKVLELYEKIEFNDNFIYLIFSKLQQVDKKEVEKDFSDFDKNYLDFLPVKIEEIFFLKATDVFKTTNIGGNEYRMFFLRSEDLKKFISLLKVEIKENY